MKFLKYHISIILPLFLLLFVFQSFFMIKKVINNYEKKINNDYSIVFVSKVPLNENDLKIKIDNVQSLNVINTGKVVDELKDTISPTNFQKLKNSLPIFYSMKLKHLPSLEKLKTIKEKLLKIEGVQSVNTFKNSYSKLYNFLIFSKALFQFFIVFVLIIVFLLIIKQSEVWIFEHKQRFEIMSILGSPFWMKSAMLYRVVIVDCIISSFLVSFVFIYFTNSDKYIKDFLNLGIQMPVFHVLHDSLVLLGIGIVISIVSVTFAIFKLNKE